MAPLGWFDFLTVIQEKSSTRVTTFGFSRDVTGGPFGDQEAELIRLLAPHVRRATIFHDIFDHAATRAMNLAAALDLVETPVLLFDAGGACIEANATAERFFATADAPRADRIPVRANSRILVPGITAAIAAAGTGLATQSLPFTLDRTGGRWFVAHVLPLTGGLRVRMNGQRRAASAMFIQTVGELRPVAR